MSLVVDLEVSRGDVTVTTRLGCLGGEVVAITGANGRGKTTLLHAVAGLIPHRGKITLDGVPVTCPPEGRQFGLVFQDRRLPPWLTAARAATMGGSRSMALHWLDELGLRGVARTKVARLSGGQQQRVAIARALAGERAALLLDEPFASLDKESVGPTRSLVLRHARAAGIPVLLVTHDSEDLDVADRVVVVP